MQGDPERIYPSYVEIYRLVYCIQKRVGLGTGKMNPFHLIVHILVIILDPSPFIEPPVMGTVDQQNFACNLIL